MSLYQLAACVAGWNKANGADKMAPPTDAEFEDMLAASAAMDRKLRQRGET